jgi:hypothetical protein
VRRRILVGVTGRWVLGCAAAAAGAVVAFLLLDPVLAAFAAIMWTTLAVIAVVASDWDRHATFEERELERARRRKEKWERGADARARDRAKFEAYRARQEAGRGQQAER